MCKEIWITQQCGVHKQVLYAPKCASQCKVPQRLMLVHRKWSDCTVCEPEAQWHTTKQRLKYILRLRATFGEDLRHWQDLYRPDWTIGESTAIDSIERKVREDKNELAARLKADFMKSEMKEMPCEHQEMSYNNVHELYPWLYGPILEQELDDLLSCPIETALPQPGVSLMDTVTPESTNEANIDDVLVEGLNPHSWLLPKRRATIQGHIGIANSNEGLQFQLSGLQSPLLDTSDRMDHFPMSMNREVLHSPVSSYGESLNDDSMNEAVVQPSTSEESQKSGSGQLAHPNQNSYEEGASNKISTKRAREDQNSDTAGYEEVTKYQFGAVRKEEEDITRQDGQDMVEI